MVDHEKPGSPRHGTRAQARESRPARVMRPREHDDMRASSGLAGANRDEKGRLTGPPPNAWRKGQSGNPGGRPSSEREVAEAARALLLDGVKALGEIAQDPRAMGMARVRAIEILMERGLGKAPQKIVIEAETASMDNAALNAFIRAQLAGMQIEDAAWHEPAALAAPD